MTTTLPVITVYDLENGAFTMNFHEILDHELVLDEAVTDFSVYINEQQISHDYYTITLASGASPLAIQPYSVGPLDDGCTFHVDVDLTALYQDGVITEDDLKGDTEITIFFFADLEGTELNGTYKSTIWYDLADGEDILYTSNVDVVEVYTYEIDIQKYDNDDQDGKRPESITISLLADGTVADTATVTEADGWAWSFTGLDKYDADGNEITYSIAEEAVADYTTTYEGYNVTNTYVQEETPPIPEPEKMNVSVTKEWNDEDNADGIRPESVTVYRRRQRQSK